MASMDDHAIYNAARLCSVLLDQSFATAGENSEKRLLIEELKGHFHIWAKYVGVFAAQRASLDSRLASFPDIKDMVIELLDMVQRNIQWDLTIASGAQEKAIPAADDEADEMDSPAITKPGLSAAETAIDKLIALGASIRRSGRQGHQLRYSMHYGGHEQSLCCLLVSRRFPHARQSLCDQIGASIHTRGVSMQYLKRHNEKLAYRRQESSDLGTSGQGDASDEESETPNIPGILCDYRDDSKQHWSPIVETLPSQVSPSRISRSRKPSGSIISRGSTVQGNQETPFDYPPKPQPRSGNKFITCSICSEPLDNRALSEDAWKAHVDRDLEPYICLSEDCREPPRFFASKRDWMDHMQTRHTITWTQKIHTEKWYCDIGHSEPLEFDHKEPFLTHLKDEHGERLSRSQFQGRARRNRRIASRDPFICPLCDCVPVNLQPYIKERPYKRLSEHIAKHLKPLAFLSLSYTHDSVDDEGSVQEASDGSKVYADARSSRDFLQHQLTEALDDIPITIVTHDGKRRIDGPDSTTFDIFDDEPLHLSDPENWLFLPPKNLPTDLALLAKKLTSHPLEIEGEQSGNEDDVSTPYPDSDQTKIYRAELDLFIKHGDMIEMFRSKESYILDVARQAACLANNPSHCLGPISILAQLALYQLVIHCDDSRSMVHGTAMADHTRLDALRILVDRIISVATRAVPDKTTERGVKRESVYVRFMNSRQSFAISKRSDIREVNFDASGPTPLGTSLLEHVLKPLVYDVLQQGTLLPRPILILTITDGAPTDGVDTFRDEILKCRDFLARRGHPGNAVRFGICQIGDDPAASRFFDRLKYDAGLQDILFCYTEPMDYRLADLRDNKLDFEEWLVGILSRSIRSTISKSELDTKEFESRLG